jgi:restriction endonuclease Mrr
MIFEEVANAPAGARPEWFEFEKNCRRLLELRGLTVLHQAANRKGDRGVDLYATAPNGQSYVVQCKCWASSRRVPPSVVRELAGAIQLADAGSAQSSCGIVVTTSSFTDGAIAAAEELGFEWIDGERFAGLL